MLKIIIVFKILLLRIAISAVLPVEKCKLEDSSCMIPAFQKAMPIFMAGMPEFGVEVLDVMEMDEIKFELAGLKFGLKDGRIKGLKNSIIDDVKWDLKNKKIDIVYHLDCNIKGHYTADGRILILPITGDGQMKLKLRHLEIRLILNYNLEIKENKEYVVPKSFTVEFDVKEGVNFNLTNLFNGNKELSDPLLLFVNENWKEITQEFGGPIIQATATKIFKSLVSFMSKVPIGDIADI